MAKIVPYAFFKQLKSLFWEIKKVGPIETWYGDAISSPDEFVACLMADNMQHPWLCRSRLKRKPEWVLVEKKNNTLVIRSNTNSIDRIIYLPTPA